MENALTTVEPVRWVGDAATGHLELLDQLELPAMEIYRAYGTAEATADAIRRMVVRGAPAIGVAAAYGVVLAAQELGSEVSLTSVEPALQTLADARPTAVNLNWALEKMRVVLGEVDGRDALDAVFKEAERIRMEDLQNNQHIGDFGAELFKENARILTICNTGSLATAGYGTALGVVRSVARADKLDEVFALETRPYLQGARLTMWELLKDGLPARMVTDGMAGYLMQQGMVDGVIVGADRIAANGDTANKIGTYQLAVLARHHNIPFFVAAPTSTLDLSTASGEGIPIEVRSSEEVTEIRGHAIAPRGARALHPAFDVTPSSLIDGIITERGVARPQYQQSLRALANAES